MTMSIPTQTKAYDVAEAYANTLTAKSYSIYNVVVSHQDGSSLWFNYAFARRYNDQNGREWLFVFTEHCGFHVFCLDDLLDWGQFQQVSIEEFSHERANDD